MRTRLLYTAAQIAEGVKRVAASIYNIRQEKHITAPLVLVGNLNGCLFFMVDLIRALPERCLFDFMQTASYGSRHSAPDIVRMSRLPIIDMRHKHIVFVDDVLETGHSASTCLHWLQRLSPTRLDAAFMFDKPTNRATVFDFPDTSFMFGINDVPDLFLYGYGLDLDGYQRQLPAVHCVLPE